jgi:hypothetical protein
MDVKEERLEIGYKRVMSEIRADEFGLNLSTRPRAANLK